LAIERTRADVELIREEVPFDGFWKLKVLHLRYRRFDGSWSQPISREVHARGGAVGVLLYDPTLDAVAFVEQFRPGPWERGDARPWLLELVAGLIEPDESPESVARRESEEEAGCLITALEPIADYYATPGGCDEYFHVFCARADLSNVGEFHGLQAENEDIRLHVVRWPEALQWMRAGRLNNAHALLAMYWMQLNRERLRAAWRS